MEMKRIWGCLQSKRGEDTDVSPRSEAMSLTMDWSFARISVWRKDSLTSFCSLSNMATMYSTLSCMHPVVASEMPAGSSEMHRGGRRVAREYH